MIEELKVGYYRVIDGEYYKHCDPFLPIFSYHNGESLINVRSVESGIGYLTDDKALPVITPDNHLYFEFAGDLNQDTESVVIENLTHQNGANPSVQGKTIIIDIDNTIVDPLQKWVEWGMENSHSFDFKAFEEDNENNQLSYNISSYFDLHEGVDFLDFFRQADLYDDMELFEDSRYIINELSKHNKIIFCSFSKSWHLKSKFSLLKRNFPWVINGEKGAMISCKHKNYIQGDYIIDDRNNFLNGHPAPIKIKMASPYVQDEELMEEVVDVVDWEGIAKIFGITTGQK